MRAVKLADEWMGLGPSPEIELDCETGPEWDVKQVRRAMVEAYVVIRTTVRRPGPAGARSFWPEFPAEEKDIWEMRRAETNTVGRMHARVQRTSFEIMNSDQAMRWPLLYLADDWHLRRVFQAWAFGRSIGVPTKAIAERKGWPHSTLRERRDRAARIIAQELNRTKVTPW